MQRIYHDVQEPMYTAAQEQFGNNPFAQLLTGNGGKQSELPLFVSRLFLSENTTAARTENTDPLPNPWAPRGAGASTAPPRQPPTQPSTNPQQPQQQPQGQQPQQQQQQPATGATANPSAGANNVPGLISPMMQNYMSQLVQNPQLLESVLQAPYMQPLMDSLAANPDLSRQIIGNNPMFANNPALREQMLSSLPAMMEQMRNPQVQALMQNREALEAITQIQEGISQQFKTSPNSSFSLRLGLQRLHTAAPNLFQAFVSARSLLHSILLFFVLLVAVCQATFA